ncbi:hypothetical protein EC973_000932 [Apophysomyces ossiformis]|uniref:PDZ-like domain-containing protein n=1 Tax=Apophysomyces ossiformis TaxID=679940 RepID=A0A8H7BKY9_9FUNG|nr:hypothetical protein EC973_000932 [Apophysomyces ossiformis]
MLSASPPNSPLEPSVPQGGRVVPRMRTVPARSKSLVVDSLSRILNSPRSPMDYFSKTPGKCVQEPTEVKSWESTLEKSIRAVVSIKSRKVYSFDSDEIGNYIATGFVVDAARGIVLTNRHVVSPGPIVAQAVLDNYEEVELKPIYRDPVHDFGFMQFDPSKVKFMELEAIELSPERAKVGLDIRVVGSDAGEKISILSGTIARLDRRAPNYGVGKYNDFNTFYLQAASGTSGGSSGSPILDIDGYAVAINAGGADNAATGFYLPLDRVKRALGYIQQGKQVPRGTLQTEFEYLSYNELRRLGLRASWEATARHKFPDEMGMLVVRSLLPKGPADGILLSGDIIIECNNEMVPNFTALFSILDGAVDQEVTLKICRGEKIEDVTVRVQCLHSITPDRFVEISGGIVHNLSYQMARSYSKPVQGVYVARGGYMLSGANIMEKDIILSVNSIPTPDIDAFIQAIQTLPDGARVPIRFYRLNNSLESVDTLNVDRHWYHFRMGVRNDLTGLWDFTEMAAPPPPKAISTPTTAMFPRLHSSMALAEKLMPSFVKVDFHQPFWVDGVRVRHFFGAGFVVSMNPPLILCDRDTVPISLGDISLTFANTITIPGKLLMLHPFYNFALITYDLALLGETPIQALEFSDSELNQGDSTHFTGFHGDCSVVCQKTTVNAPFDVDTSWCYTPRWRSTNVEGINIASTPDCQGVLTDSEGKVQAFWIDDVREDKDGNDVGFRYGLSTSLVKPTLAKIIKGEEIVFRGLDVEFWTLPMATARVRGLSDAWIHRIESSGTTRYNLLYVLSILDQRSPCAKVLCVGDIVLTINDKIITRLTDLVHIHEETEIEMVLLRDGEELKVNVPLNEFSGNETKRIACWQGAIIQDPYKASMERVKVVPEGVYISHTLGGSPASSVLYKGSWIVEVQETPVTDLDSFLKAVRSHELDWHHRHCRSKYTAPVGEVAEGESQQMLKDDNVLAQDEDATTDNIDNEGYLRIRIGKLDGSTSVVVVKLDLHYWDTWELIQDESAICGWVRQKV